MKNQFLVLILILFPFLTNAQESSSKNFQLGFTLTPNVGWLRDNDNDPNTIYKGSKIGFSYGILADLGLSANKNYYFSTAFTVTTINGKGKVNPPPPSQANDTFFGGESEYKLQYIEIPVTLKLKSNETAIGRFYGQFGLGTAIKVGAKADVSSYSPSGGIAGTQNNVNIKQSINNFRLGLIAGGGAEWKLDKNLALQTGITFNNGFTDIFDGDPNARSSYFAFNLGIFF
ncbi:outer membrane beta-barrel protein [Rubrolithibacter danxiaensis]|uniref:outer membrane beta-barrel protein n=1 Tax=Rubrolithibacter danxiaensis TaxID=3390805 RepID=UPI003BF8C880